MAKKIILLAVLAVLGFSMIGCQTMQGVGGDIRWLAGARD